MAAIALPIAGVLYQKVGERTDRRRYATKGRSVRLGRTSIYVNDLVPARRDAGAAAATVLFESGIGATSQNWARLQRVVANHARAVSYDRPGLGWSTGPASTPTPEHLARNLRALLAAAQIPGPYLLVAHSFGGLVARRFAADYPNDVLGLVLVDPMRPSEWPPLNPDAAAALSRGKRLASAGQVAAWFGVSRLFMRSTLLGSRRTARILCRIGGEHVGNLMDRMLGEVGKMPREVWPAVVANWSRPEFYRTLADNLRAIPETVTSMSAAPAVTVPVTVLTPETVTPLSEVELRAISTDARQIITPNSAHWVHLDQPEIVLDAIRHMLMKTTPQT